MSKGIEMNRPQRLHKLTRLGAPNELLRNEVRLAMQEWLDLDVKDGMVRDPAWIHAAWALVVSLNTVAEERDALKKQVRRLQKDAKAKRKEQTA